MSKTKLTYITPVLDFVQAESEGLFFWGGGSVYGSDTEPPDGGDGWDCGTEAKDFYFQFDDSDADFFYFD